MDIEGQFTGKILSKLQDKFSLTNEERMSLEMQIEWFAHHIELEAYLSANRLMGVQNEGMHLPLVVLDEDQEIQEITLPHKIDWLEESHSGFKDHLDKMGIKLASVEPSDDFMAFYAASLPTQLSKIIEQTVEYSRANGTDIGLYLPEQTYISKDLENGDTVNVVNTIETDTLVVEAKMLSKPLVHRFFTPEVSRSEIQPTNHEHGVSR